MYPSLYEKYVSLAVNGTPQEFFEDALFRDIHAWNFYSLDTGILDFYDLVDVGRTNCTHADTVFAGKGRQEGAGGDPSTALGRLWSCAFFGNLTNDFRKSRISSENKTSLLDNDIDTSATTSAKVTPFLSTCVAACCENSVGSQASSCGLDQLVLNDNMISAERTGRLSCKHLRSKSRTNKQPGHHRHMSSHPCRYNWLSLPSV
jgi:hypothetical protein